ncbi:MAG: hypothetical protein H6684_12330 [Deltaproteobacteria bacterium]|nr:hypothetical protein [Deltaproteobacteria bacterium]
MPGCIVSRWKNAAIVLAILTALLTAASPAQADKYAVSMFHFNVQYVAGGLRGFAIEAWDQTDEENQDMIIEESFEPVLDLFLAHPGWGVDLEMQGLMVEVMAERHPTVLNKLRTLAKNGQASVISFHYSDQLFTGFPYEAWEDSVRRTQQVFEDNDIPLSKTVFCQEGQAAMGMAQAMEDWGYETLVWPKNLWRSQHGEFPPDGPDPYYTFGNLDLVVGSQGLNYNSGELELTWTFFNDGELLATGDWDPYFPTFFKYKEEAVEEYEAKLQNLEDNGWKIATVAEYVEAAKESSHTPSDPPDLFDGTWQPESTNGVFRWLGGPGAIWFNQERDNAVRTLNAIAYRELLAARVAADEADLDVDDELDEAWRLLTLGMVTDATGINPYKGEVLYGISHAGEAARMARNIIDQAKAELALDKAAIDVAAESMEEADPQTSPAETTAPITLEIVADGRTVNETWYEITTGDPKIRMVELEFSAGDSREISVTFPGNTDDIVFTSALVDDVPVTYDRADFNFSTDGILDGWPMALTNGMINIDDDLFVIKDQGLVHLAAIIRQVDQDVTFMDGTATRGSTVTWRFWLVEGTASQALDLADEINVKPVLIR